MSCMTILHEKSYTNNAVYISRTLKKSIVDKYSRRRVEKCKNTRCVCADIEEFTYVNKLMKPLLKSAKLDCF